MIVRLKTLDRLRESNVDLTLVVVVVSLGTKDQSAWTE